MYFLNKTHLYLLRAFIVSSQLISSLSAANIDASYDNSFQVPLSASSYNATGHTISISLNHHPAAQLTVVENTGLGFIQGEFSNLANGQSIDLDFGGVTYAFVAWYYGGTGNDLVLLRRETLITAWGVGGGGMLGDGSTGVNRLRPVAVDQSGVLAEKTLVAIAAAEVHSLALSADGAVVSWGQNGSGQLGDGSVANQPTPVLVDQSGVLAGKTVVAIAAGQWHNLALCSDGTVAAWGENSQGQLGNNTFVSSAIPVAVDHTGVLTGKQVISIAAGSRHSLVLCSDGTLYGWGANTNGELGTGIGGVASAVPVVIDPPGPPPFGAPSFFEGKTVTQIATGSSSNHNLALCADGTLVAWGRNDSGQLGVGNNFSQNSPVAINQSGFLAGKTVIDLATGGNGSLVVCGDGTIAVWGTGILGDDEMPDDHYAPYPVYQDGTLKNRDGLLVAAGSTQFYALGTDNFLATWGEQTSGEGHLLTRNVPVQVDQTDILKGQNVRSLAAGEFHALALSSPFRAASDSDADGFTDLAEVILSGQGLNWSVADVSGNTSFLAETGLFSSEQQQQAAATGRNEVLTTPNDFDLYRLSQIQALNLDAPLLQRNEATGNFILKFSIRKSINLQTFSPVTLTASDVTINNEGQIEYNFAPSDGAAFYRIEAEE